MTETHDQLPAQLCFRAARWNTYGRNLGWQMFMVAFSVFMWVFVAVLLGLSQNAVVVASEILGIIVALFFTAIALAGPVSYVWDARRNRRIWHQFRRPVAVIDGTGIRYEPESGPVAVPWADVEQLVLERDRYTRRTTSYLSLRVTPEAGILRAGRVRVPPRRGLKIGYVGQAGVPDEVALEVLRRAAGSRLKVRERDHRPAGRDGSVR